MPWVVREILAPVVMPIAMLFQSQGRYQYAFPRIIAWIFAAWLLGAASVSSSFAQTAQGELSKTGRSELPPPVRVDLPEFSRTAPIVISAQAANQWQQGAYEVWILRGNCLIQQGTGYAKCAEAVLWIDRAEATESKPNKIIAYLEGSDQELVEVATDSKPDAPSLKDKTWLGRFHSIAPIEVRVPRVAGKPVVWPQIYVRAMERRKSNDANSQWHSRIEDTPKIPPVDAATQEANNAVLGRGLTSQPLTATVPGSENPLSDAATNGNVSTGMRRIHIYRRSEVPMQFSGWSTDPNNNQWTATFDSGVTIFVEGATIKELGQFSQLGTIDISADRVVIWATGTQQPDLSGQTAQSATMPLEFYLEGNIVFRQGDRIIHADRMYYDVTRRVGTILNAEILTPVPNYNGKVRLKAEIVQQTSQDRYFAQNAYLTSSRMGEPGYRLQSGDMTFEDVQHPAINPWTGQPEVDSTGQAVIEHEKLATANNDVLFVGPVPIFYWPTITTDLNDGTYYIRRAQLKQDNVFGTQVLTEWNGYDFLGIHHKPSGTDFDVSLGYLSKRGFGHGASFTYDRDEIFGFGERSVGLFSYWGIADNGTDNLGVLRRNVPPGTSYRERLYWQHRTLLENDFQLSAEVGWISDRNFLEEYYKNEWENLKDESTDVELKRITENRSWSIFASAHINDFVTETEWLPRFDHYWMGQSLLNDSFTWFEHSNIGYARFERLNAPESSSDQPFSYLPWESASSRVGERVASRQELDYPFQIGDVKIVPFVMGEAAHWGQDINGEPLDRLWGEVGIRASLPMWSVDPGVSSDLLNLHGIAHKIVWKAQFTASDSNRDLTDLPLYDALDDDSVEAFRRHFVTTTFGWPSTIPPTVASIPTRFDERYYAIRAGLQDWTSSPSTEMVGDLMAMRLGAEQRWQTKRGSTFNERIIDWITLDTNITFYPEADRDNFGSAAGLADYNFTWHVGDRLTLLSDGVFDFFDEGQKIVEVGGFLTRPPRGQLYAGFRYLDGPIHYEILSMSYSYRMSPKWLMSFGTTFDLRNNGNIGENFSFTRIGESFLISAGVNVDTSRDSVGVNFTIEPRCLARRRVTNESDAKISSLGANGLE
jgi:hypothetical protein